MIVSWNTRGLNKISKLRDISSRLLELGLDISILIETRVKNTNADKVRSKLNLPGRYEDNYSNHNNGKIWIVWNEYNIDLRVVNSSNQHIHYGIYDNNGSFKYWMTAVYAHNQLDLGKRLWKIIENLQHSRQGPWCVIGDYNNVLTAQDIIGGNLVTKAEYEDLHNMMNVTGLGEMDNTGEFFTWSNKQSRNHIYSRIDRVLDNVSWFQDNCDATLNILPPIYLTMLYCM